MTMIETQRNSATSEKTASQIVEHFNQKWHQNSCSPWVVLDTRQI